LIPEQFLISIFQIRYSPITTRADPLYQHLIVTAGRERLEFLGPNSRVYSAARGKRFLSNVIAKPRRASPGR